MYIMHRGEPGDKAMYVCNVYLYHGWAILTNQIVRKLGNNRSYVLLLQYIYLG